MKECVIVPTWHRSSFLYVCLEAIREAEPDLEIHVFPDRGTNEDEVCGRFGAFSHLVPDHKYHGNSYNMFEALRWAYEAGYDRVFVVEDDCVVKPDFFSWARNALDNPKAWNLFPFAASGWIYSPDAPDEDGPDVICTWYLSVCSAIPRRSLEKIVKHANENYYANMQGYLDRAFPKDPQCGSQHWEQDGAILRVANSVGERVTWPRRARGTHIGWHGYHMPHGKVPQGELEKQVLVVKMALANGDVMRQLMAGGQVPDVVGCEDCLKPLVTTSRKARLVCVPCFHKKHPDAPRAAESHYYLRPASRA